MSMSNYSIEVFGLILTNDEITYFENKLKEEIIKENPENKEDLVDLTIEDMIDEDMLNANVSHSMAYIRDIENGKLYTLEHKSDYLPEDILAIYANKSMQMIGAAYDTADELINEFKNDIGKYLPEDFDWKSHIGLACGVIFG